MERFEKYKKGDSNYDWVFGRFHIDFCPPIRSITIWYETPFDGKWDIAEIRTDSEDVLIEVLSVFEKFE